MSENHFFDAVFLKNLREKSLGGFCAKRRIMNHCKQPVAFLPDFFNLFEAQPEPFRFAQVKLFVVVGVVGTSRTRPTARTANYNIAELYAIVLKKEKAFVRRGVAQLGYAVPPIVVVTADKDFFTI